MENFLWSVHLTVGWCTSADLLCLCFSYTPIYILYIGTSQSKKLFIAPSMYKALYWHSEGQRLEKVSLLWEEREEKPIATGTQLNVKHYFPDLRSTIIQPFFSTILCGRLYYSHSLDKETEAQRDHWSEPCLLNSEVPLPPGLIICSETNAQKPSYLSKSTEGDRRQGASGHYIRFICTSWTPGICICRGWTASQSVFPPHLSKSG